MHRIIIFTLFWTLAGASLLAADIEGRFVTTDGRVIVGKVISFNDDGVVFRRSERNDSESYFTKRIHWEKLDIESQKLFLADPETKAYVEVYLGLAGGQLDEATLEVLERPKPAPIIVSDDSRPGRPHANVGMLGAMTAGGGLTLSFLLFLGNLYAAFEIARFKRVPALALCGAAVVLPVVAPLVAVFLPRIKLPSLKSLGLKPAEQEYHEDVEDFPMYEEPAESAVADALPETQVFERGQFNFNRRFVETTFAGFFRAVPGEREQDMELVFVERTKANVTRRILRATQAEIFIEIDLGEGVVGEQPVALAELVEIRLKHQLATE